MEFKQYPSYKNSGVEWLGDVPEHWESNRLKKYLIERNEKNSPIKTDNLLSVTMYQGVIPVSEKQGNGGNKPKENLENYKISYPNDIVLNSMNVIVGSVGLNKYTGLISPAYYALYNRNKNNNIKFFSYIFHNPFFQKGLFGLGNGIMYKESEDGKLNTIRLKIPMEKLNQVVLPCPSISEQNQIVAFLDTETARIDNLISKQEKLIELLEEQRKSIISHAVTKGLNPNAPMKDSGVEWLGEVPEHWDVAVVKRAFIVKLGKMLQPDQKDETDVIKKYLKASNLTWDGVKDIDNEMWFSKNDLKKLKLEIGDLLVAEGGDVGKSCIFDSNEEFYYQNSVNRVRGQKNNANKFLYYWLFTLKYSGYIDILCNKSTIAHFTAEKLNETILLLPDSVEQNEIIAYLERENGKINQLILKQQSLIEKLKEYRASIISHAVTGKIDVREFGA